MNNSAKSGHSLLDKIGIPASLAWGFVGLFFFVTGATIEQGWFSSSLVNSGFSSSSAGLIFTVYGIAVAVFAWLTGACTQIFGIRRLMLAGVILYFVGSLPLVLVALPQKSYWLIMLVYTIRGASYPLFAYSFLVWLNYRAPMASLARAMSCFWITFGLGMTVFAPYFSSAFMFMGKTNLFYFGFVLVIIGAVCALVLNHDDAKIPQTNEAVLKGLFDSFTLIFRRPRLGLGVIVKAINDIGKFGYVIVMPIYLIHYGYSTSEWLTVWAIVNIVGYFFNYLFGYIADSIGWRKTLVYFSGTFCGLGTLGLWLVPVILGHNLIALFMALVLYTIGLGGFVPLSAIIPNLVPENKGAAISALNLGSGLSNFLGPLIVSIFISPFGSAGALIALAVVYFLASPLSYFLKTPDELNQAKRA
ncbi:major facilitator superfamily transporter [Paucilactobacillus hokkaidonensis JCM 18461]|uniref:Major facilitator superfamily transporter n=1 Tax=Paucilactobacillus hokkaidonensis JCM 18461 TaxID=1291742 RepID=A0A0A1GUI3_9LACO|nr:MFS transporter [Paucilactobacillus hokkaidonensis]BAP84659.1 major facilitator superfamily transporter [Paucilactobacillus hokkaidonensis JCM 18461]